MKIPILQIYWFPINHWDFLQYLPNPFKLWARNDVTAATDFFLVKCLNWLLPNHKDKQFYGYHKWGWSRNNFNSNTKQKTAQRISVKSHQPKYEPRKIPKINKINVQWAVFLIPKHTLKTSVWLLITVAEAVSNSAEVHHWRDLF